MTTVADMAYVKLDCGMLDSTLWIDRCARELFITALLMAEPWEVTKPLRQIKVRELVETNFEVPPGWYGFVPAASTGIIRRCGMEAESGMKGLERLGEPEAESRTPDFEGRRMVRVDGGWIILNFDRYRNKDHTAAERSRRYRERNKASRVANVTSRVASRSVTQAKAKAEVLSSGATAPEVSKATLSHPLRSGSEPSLVPTAEDIYNAYPRKVSKPDGILAIKKALKKHGASYLLERTIAYSKTQPQNNRFTPHPATWFNGCRFDDDPQTWTPKEPEPPQQCI